MRKGSRCLSCGLGAICNANRINAAPKTQLASATQPSDFQTVLCSQNCYPSRTPRFVEGRKPSNFYTALGSTSSAGKDVFGQNSLSGTGRICHKWAIVLRSKKTAIRLALFLLSREKKINPFARTIFDIQLRFTNPAHSCRAMKDIHLGSRLRSGAQATSFIKQRVGHAKHQQFQ
jgi:hypothetical protein